MRQHCESREFELTEVSPAQECFSSQEIANAFLGASPVGHEGPVHPGAIEKRLLRHERTLFAGNANVNSPLPLGSLESLGIRHEDYGLAMTPSLRTSLYAGRVTDAMLSEGKYLDGDLYTVSSLFPASDPVE